MVKKLYLVILMKKIKSFLNKCKILGIPINEIVEIEQSVKEKGGIIYLIGGNVRDLILEKPATTHPDIVVNLKLNVLIECLNKSNIKFTKVGSEFGSIVALINDYKIDVTCMRSDVKTDGRWAKIKFTSSLEEDSKRRDFTINSIYCDINGNIEDPNNGIEDLKNNKIKFIGNIEQRINEDYLRILRFYRFSIILGCDFEKKSVKICEKNFAKLKKLSFNRRIEEIKKILLDKNIKKTKYLFELKRLFRYSLESELNFNNFKKLCDVETKINDISFERRVKFLLRSKNKIPRFFSNNASKKLRERLKSKFYFIEFTIFELNSFLYNFNKEIVFDKILFDWCDGQLSDKKFNAFRIIVQNFKKKSLPLNGQDLQKIGFKQGKNLGKIIKKLELKFIEQDFRFSKQNSIKFVKQFLPRG